MGIYPMYTYAHPIEDAIERITPSICTLEYEDQRPFNDCTRQAPIGGFFTVLCRSSRDSRG